MMVRIALLLLAFAAPLHAEVNIQQVTSPGGIKAWLVEDHGIPFTSLSIDFKGGTSLDKAGKRGSVNLMAALIEEGSGDLDSQGFAAARDSLAASFNFDSGPDAVSVSAKFLTENRDQAMQLLHDALVNPTFDQASVDRVREQVLSNVRSDAKDPSAIATNLERRNLFGDHPYGSDGSGTVDSVTALTRDDIVTANHDTLAMDRITVGAAGDISATDLGVLLDKLFAGLPAKGADQPARVDPVLKGGITVQSFPGPQTNVVFAQGGMSFTNPDYYAASVLNEIIGGGRFTARLMSEVREKRGLTYGIGTSLANLDHSEVMMGQFQASNDKVAEAIKVIRDQWALISKEGVSQQDLDDAKTYMTGAYPLRFDGNARIASILVGMQSLGLPADYPKTRNARIEAVTLADINRVAALLIQPKDLQFVVVGQPTGVVNE
ncbi:MAG: M16 family metallopeptidase [Cypionkella sp.]